MQLIQICEQNRNVSKFNNKYELPVNVIDFGRVMYLWVLLVAVIAVIKCVCATTLAFSNSFDNKPAQALERKIL